MLGRALLLTLLATQAVASSTERVFADFAEGVVKIQVVGERSESKSLIGTGFFVSETGHLLTNYHVVSKAIFNPDTHRAELVWGDESVSPLNILAVDVVRDLAVLKTDAAPPGRFTFQSSAVEQGQRIYSLGHPHDLGLSIVEGTYNGLLDTSFFDKIHLTVSLNPGMSGGPTITQRGEVVGVNVATAGNQVSFVIPAARGAALLARVTAAEFTATEDLRDEVQAQLLAHQQTLLAPLATGEQLAASDLGNYKVPGEFAPFLDCWGDDSEKDDHLFETSTRECSTRDAVFVENGVELGSISFKHQLLSTSELNRFRFHELYAERFKGFGWWSWANADDLTAFVCETAYVDHSDLTLKTTFCARRYRNLEDLYDIVFKAATVGRMFEGLHTTLNLSGVSFEAGRRIAQLFLETFERTGP